MKSATEPIPYLVMEGIPGQTLQQRMDGHGSLEVPDVLRIGQQDGSRTRVNLIHRDIKPSNILLSDVSHERARISDFGLARAVGNRRGHSTLRGASVDESSGMPRTSRASRGGFVDHVLNRGNGRSDVFHNDDDFAAFVTLMRDVHAKVPMRLTGFV